MLNKIIFSKALLLINAIKYLENKVKDSSTKKWFWTILITLPITFYLIELFIGDAQSTVFSFLTHAFSSALGVFLGYHLFTKGFAKISHFKYFEILAFAIIMLLVISISMLVGYVGFDRLSIIVSKALILSFSTSAIIFVFSSRS